LYERLGGLEAIDAILNDDASCSDGALADHDREASELR
jgi:hypothetical protein